MTAERIRQFLKRQPFQPFKINMTDGRALEVRHPDFVVLPPGWDTTAIVTFPDYKFEFIYIRNITGIESEGTLPPLQDRRRRDESEE
jgi:hypothetical protein